MLLVGGPTITDMELFCLFGLVCDEMFDMDLFVGPFFWGGGGGVGCSRFGECQHVKDPRKNLGTEV